MDSKNGGQQNSDLQRQAAAGIARRKVLAAYTSKTDNKVNTTSETHFKDNPVNTKIDSESWKKYHNAWQNYYQKYYSEYYSNAARDYIAKEKLKAAREQADEDEILRSLTKTSKTTEGKTGLNLNTSGEEKDRDWLKKKIRAKATENAKKSRRAKKFAPILAGIAVVLLILFLQYNRLIFAPIMAYVSPGNVPASEIEALDPNITQTVSPDPRLIIPKLNIDVPIRFDISLSEVMSAMNNGVAHYRIAGASAYPGEIGNFVITGHSAGDIYSSNPYKYIFSGLERLENGDLIYVNYQSIRYTYKVVRKEVVEPTNVAALVIETDKPLITLVTCTPLGTSRYRLLVTGEQISPSYNNDKKDPADDDTKEDLAEDEGIVLPSNEPSFFEGIWNWLTGQ